jgi:aminopeptidase
MRQRRLIDWLRGKAEVHIRGGGTDLRLSIKDRPFCNADGHLNMPDGEVYSAPVEDSLEGSVTFADGVRLRFAGGRVVEASGGDIEGVLAGDVGARRVGEFAVGTNAGLTRYTGNTAPDEKLGGTVHLALGASLPGTGGTNASATHRDLVCDLRRGGEVTVDGVPFLRDGAFLVG